MDVEGMEGEGLVADNGESNTEPPRRRDSSDPVNLSLNSGASVTSESSHDIHRLVFLCRLVKLIFLLRENYVKKKEMNIKT